MADHDDVGPDDARVLDALRGLAGGGPAADPAPSPAVWDRIAAEAFGEAGAAPDHDDGRAPAAVVPISSRRPARLGLWVAGAAAAVVLLVVGGLLVRAGDDAGDAGPVATGELERLDDEGEPGVTATLVDVDGRAQLQVDTSGLPDPDGYYEVWLGTPELDGLISLGPVRPDGTYDLPAGVDVSEFPVVDVSAEPLDGDPTHSAVSLLRGQLV